MDKYQSLVFVDCEARGASPVNGIMTEFGAVHFTSRYTFHGRLYEGTPDPANPAKPLVGERIATDTQVAHNLTAWLGSLRDEGKMNYRTVLVSDNPAYDFMWVAAMYDRAGMDNPFGHSGRRISDFWAGVKGDWSDSQSWKRFRKTPHDHNPVNDAMGNVEAFAHILWLMRGGADDS
jgi:hypothetical protein